MELLTAINRVLPALGENPVDSVDSRNPTIAVIRNAIEAKNADIQLREWWFNTFKVTLMPGDDGCISLPNNTLSWIPDSVESVQRGTLLFNPDTLNSVWPVGTALKGRIRFLVPFQELPEVVATYVLYAACVQAYINDIGVEEALGEWKREGATAQMLSEQEHLRNRKYTTSRSRRYRAIQNARWG